MRYIKVCLLVAGLLVGRANAELVGFESIDFGGPVPVAAPAAAPEPDRGATRLAESQADDKVDFINGDSLHGRLAAASATAGQLTWKHAAAAEDILFETGSLAQIRLATRRASASAEYDAVIHLTNDDILPGRIVAMNDDILDVDTWFAGRVKINRRMVRSILPNLSMSNVLFEGPNELAEWTLYSGGGNRPQWRYSDGAMYALQRYPAGRLVEGLPDQYEVRFDAAWRGSYPQFTFVFNTPDVQQHSDAYLLNVQSSSITLSRYSRNSGSSTIGSRINYSDFDSNSGTRSASFVLLVDKEARRFTLLIDGNMAGQWTDPAEYAGLGDGIAFRPGSNGDLKISRIKVAHWDGRVPGATGSSEAADTDDQVRFVNDDKFSGRIVSIADGVLKFETSYATLDVPINRVMEIVMADEKAERARRNRDDVRATFVERGLLTVNLDRIEDDVLHGESENFGSIAVPLWVMKTIEWNIYREKQEEESDDF